MKGNILEVDSFFENPDSIREAAFDHPVWSSDNHPEKGNWPGQRSNYISAIDDNIFNQIIKNFYKTQGWPLLRSVYFESFFQFCYESDGSSWVHHDIMDQGWTHVCIVYLNPNAPTSAGTLFYEHKDGKTIEELEAESGGYVPGDESEYKIVHDSVNIYNKAVVYLPNTFHKSNIYFGDNPRNGRLTNINFIRDNESQ